MKSLHHLAYAAASPHALPPRTDALILPPFSSNTDYLDARLAELKMRLLFNGCSITDAALSGFSMHVDEQSLLFGSSDPTFPTAWSLPPEEQRELQAQLVWVAHENRLRAQASRAAGISLPLESLRDAFSLRHFEEQVLLLALAFAIHPSFQKLHALFHPRAHSHDVMGPSVRTAIHMLTETPKQRIEALRHFAPTATLRERRLIVCQPPHSWTAQAPLEQYIVFLDPGILLALLGQAQVSDDAIVSWPKDVLDLDVIELPATLADELRDVLARFLVEHGPAPSLAFADNAGNAGSAGNADAVRRADTADAMVTADASASPLPGEALFAEGLICHLDLAEAAGPGGDADWPVASRLVRWAHALAHATQRPLLRVDLATLSAPQSSASDAPQTPGERLLRVCRDARLQGAALLLEGGQAWSTHQPPDRLTDVAGRSSDTPQAPKVRETTESLSSTPTNGAPGAAAAAPGATQSPLSVPLLRRALQGFGGLLIVDHASLLAAVDGERRPSLRLSRDATGQVQLHQQGGPLVRRVARRQGLVGLEEHLCQRVVGQEAALHRLAEVLRVRKAQVDANPRKPDGVFLLAGPSGVGKTETAKALNEAIFGTPDSLIRLDMSEFHFRESISGLIGTTPGWVGYERGGRLTNAIQKNPEAIVLLDEIEKAHPQVLDVFLQVFDDGRLTDGKGQTVDMSRATFLMTSNIGAQLFAHDQRLGFVKESSRASLSQDLRGSLRKHLRPEFLNRIDEILVYFPLDAGHLKQICYRSLRALQIRFARKGIWLTIDAAIASFIAAQATPEDGARSLQRHIEQELAQPLAAQMLAHPQQTQISLSLRDGAIIVEEDAS